MTGGVEQQQQMMVEPETIEFLGMTIDKTDFFTAIAIALVTGAIALVWWIVRRRIQRKFPLPSEKAKTKGPKRRS